MEIYFLGGFLFLSIFIVVIIFIGYLTGFALYQFRFRELQNRGEAAVRRVVLFNFPAPKYHLLNNITIPFEDGTTQIDHVLISTKGIFVIETKDYSGWIFGNANSKHWMQVIYKVKNQFQNPLHQNYLHVKSIQKLMDFLPEGQIHSVVVFTGKGEFKTPMPKNVIYLNNLAEYLRGFQEDTISINRLEFCVGRLECKRYELTGKTDIQHQAYLAKKFG